MISSVSRCHMLIKTEEECDSLQMISMNLPQSKVGDQTRGELFIFVIQFWLYYSPPQLKS
jgi:hypothetical protein